MLMSSSIPLSRPCITRGPFKAVVSPSPWSQCAGRMSQHTIAEATHHVAIDADLW
jgi:hypothetical protein